MWGYRFVQEHSRLPLIAEWVMVGAVCPHCLDHDKLMGTPDWQNKFQKWHKRPWKSWALYWRMHPEQHPWGDAYKGLGDKRVTCLPQSGGV